MSGKKAQEKLTPFDHSKEYSYWLSAGVTHLLQDGNIYTTEFKAVTMEEALKSQEHHAEQPVQPVVPGYPPQPVKFTAPDLSQLKSEPSRGRSRTTDDFLAD